MRPLAALERFFERLFERPAARLFRVQLQPVQLQRRIERAMESQRLVESNRTLVPNRYLVRLNPEDLAGFDVMVDDLATDLADAALQFARSHRYLLTDRPRVELAADPRVASGDVKVDASFIDERGARRRQRQPDEEAVSPSGGLDEGPPEGADASDERKPEAAERTRPSAPETPATAGQRRPPAPAESARADQTMVFEIPRPAVPLARLRIDRGADLDREIVVGGQPVQIGRASDNDLVVPDPRISRHHARLQVRRGSLILADLGSTNGTRVNGVRVDEVVLGEGDEIEIGDTVLVVESLPTA